MTPRPRLPSIHHTTSHPYCFFGRQAEVASLEDAFQGGQASVVALVGPGGQGKTAILQHWLDQLGAASQRADGLFFWSFYRGKDVDLCLRTLYGYAAGLAGLPEVSASYCVDQLLSLLRRERWALLLDGAEVVQYESGAWFGRFIHPELGRLLDETAGAPMPGALVLTTRFPIPGLSLRHHARVVSLGGLDGASARSLLASLGVHGSEAELEGAAASCACHAKAVELLGTYLARFASGEAGQFHILPDTGMAEGCSAEEHHVARILTAFQTALPQETQDILALATAFREPPTEAHLLEYLASPSVRQLLHSKWERSYRAFGDRPAAWLVKQLQELVALRLLERVGRPTPAATACPPAFVMDAHPLVRRGFEHVLGEPGQRQSAQSRAGFLRGRPDRRRPESLEQTRQEVELFHAYCDAHLWNEADGVLVALENPKHRFLAPAFERELLLRFFPEGDWRRPPLWPGFGRYRSLAICLELLGEFEEALAAYRDADHPLRGDALIALGRLGPLLNQPQAPAPWQVLWQAYRAHALCLAGRAAEALALARSLVPVDVYEWVHVFECLLRAGQLQAVDLRSLLFKPPQAAEHRWSELARQRMRLDFLRLRGGEPPTDLQKEYEHLLEAYDQGGLHFERSLVRLSYGRWLLEQNALSLVRPLNATTLQVAQRHGMTIMEADAWELQAEIARRTDDQAAFEAAQIDASRIRIEVGYHGPGRP